MQRLRLPEQVPAEIQAWQLQLALGTAPSAADIALLNAAELAAANRLHQPDDRLRAVAGRAHLRRLLGAAIDMPPRDVPLVVGRHGKPVLQDRASPAFNVSHSGAWVLIALGAVDAVGIDVERHRGDFQEIAPHAMTADELREWQQEPDACAGFYERWCGKEAALKAAGVGVASHLQALSLARQPGGFSVHSGVAELQGLHLASLPLVAGYSAALAWRFHRLLDPAIE